MARKALKAGVLTAPLPPVLATVGTGDEANIITIGWTGILSTHPPRTYISVRPERHSHSLLRRHGEFVINLTTVDMAKKVDYCGIYTGAKVDKFKECGFTKVDSREVAVPSIGECPLSLECRVVEVIPMGTHDVFIADVVAVSVDDSILDEDGKLRFDKAGLLAYAHGEYYALGEKVGRFGFSTDKPKKGEKKPAAKPTAKPAAKPVAKPAAKPTDEKSGQTAAPKAKPDQKRNSPKNGEGKKPTAALSKAAQDKKNNTPDKSAQGRQTAASGNKTAAQGRAEQSSNTADGHRPFYLDAPRGRKKGGKRK